MIAPRPRPRLLDPTPVWSEPDDGDDLRAARGIVRAVLLGCVFWLAVGAAVAWLWLT